MKTYKLTRVFADYYLEAEDGTFIDKYEYDEYTHQFKATRRMLVSDADRMARDLLMRSTTDTGYIFTYDDLREHKREIYL